MKFIKENSITILLVSLIIIILLALEIFIYKMTIEYNNNSNIVVEEIPTTMINNNMNESNKIIEQVEDEISKNKSNSISVEENDRNTQIVESTLIQIANIFNNCNPTQEMKLQGYTMNATALDNEITVFSSGDGLSFSVEFMINDNILSADIIYNETDSRITAIKLILAVMLVDCVGQMKGFPERTLSTALGDERAINYTLENEGVEIKQLDNGQAIAVRVDLNSNLSFLNIQ